MVDIYCRPKCCLWKTSIGDIFYLFRDLYYYCVSWEIFKISI